jgi:hypothetical protein
MSLSISPFQTPIMFPLLASTTVDFTFRIVLHDLEFILLLT